MSLSDEDIVALLDKMEKQAKALRDDVLRMCWYMRGSISYDEAMILSLQDREIINTIIKENMETTQKTKLPFF